MSVVVVSKHPTMSNKVCIYNFKQCVLSVQENSARRSCRPRLTAPAPAPRRVAIRLAWRPPAPTTTRVSHPISPAAPPSHRRSCWPSPPPQPPSLPPSRYLSSTGIALPAPHKFNHAFVIITNQHYYLCIQSVTEIKK